MKICVFGAASEKIDKEYISTVEELGRQISKRGHSLVFGCGRTGLMGAAARGVHSGGGRIVGVIPKFFCEQGIELVYEESDEIIYTETMRERKAIMEDLADAFIVVPGGFGTFEELFEILTLKQLNRHDKPIAILDICGYYKKLDEFIYNSAEQGFIAKPSLNVYKTFTDINETLDFVEQR